MGLWFLHVTGITDALAGGTQTQTFTYDTLDRLLTAVASGGSGGTYAKVTYAYDVNGRLLNGPLGNGYVYHAAKKHAVTAAGGAGFTYDANGNMTGRTVGGQSFTLVYDAENRLVQVSGAVAASFVYDGDGSRVKGTVGGVTTVYLGGFYEKSGSAVKKYYEAGGQTVALRDGNTLH